MNVLAQARTPVYFAIGAQDSYYGSTSFVETYNALHALYEQQGLTDEAIDKLIVLDVRPPAAASATSTPADRRSPMRKASWAGCSGSTNPL